MDCLKSVGVGESQLSDAVALVRALYFMNSGINLGCIGVNVLGMSIMGISDSRLTYVMAKVCIHDDDKRSSAVIQPVDVCGSVSGKMVIQAVREADLC